MQLLLKAILVIASISITLLGLVVLRQRKRAENVVFAVLALSVSLWIASNFLALSKTSIFTVRLTYAFGTLAIAGSLSWILLLARKNLKFLIVSYSWGFLAFLFSLTPFCVTNVLSYSITRQRLEFGFMFPVLSIWFLVTLLLDLIILFYVYKRAIHLKKIQIRFIVTGILLSGAIAVSVSFLLPLLGITKLIMLDSPSTIFFIAFTAYAIIKHRLMDIRLVVLRSVAYSVLVAAIGGTFVLLISFLRSSYAKVLRINPDILFVIAAFVAVFGFQPLRRLLERVTDKIFYKKRYNPQKLLGELNTKMSSTVHLGELINFVVETLSKEMKLGKVAVLLDGQREKEEVRGQGFEIPKSAFSRVMKVCRHRKIVIADEFEDGSKEKEVMREFDIAVLVPLVTEDNILAIIILGNKQSGDMYTLQDIQFLEILAPEAAIAIKNAELFEEKNLRVRELTALNKLAFSLGTNLNLKTILNRALKQVMFVTEADSGSIMLLDEESQMLSIEAAKGIKKEVLGRTRIKLGEGISGWVAKTKEPLILVDDTDPRFKKELKRQEIISAITVPLMSKEKVIGVLNVNRKNSPEIFSKENLNIVTSFAGQLAVAIENAKLYKDLEGTFLGTISALAAAVDAKDPYTFGHSNEVTEYAVAIAKEMGLSHSKIETIRIAATLHDIGKIGIDGSILNKPGKLTADERLVINRHPTIAVNILESLDFLQDTVPLILFHHERIDGKGYPSGIGGDAIPLGARIIAVVDSFNAMVSDRPYRKAMELEVAIKELKDNAGTQFDPDVVDAFLKVLAKMEGKERQVKHSTQNGFTSQK